MSESRIRVVTHSAAVGCRTIAEAFEVSKRLSGVDHEIQASNDSGEYVPIKRWHPDCVDANEDTFGGIVNNQWEAP